MVTLYSLGSKSGQLSSISITVMIKSAVVDSDGFPEKEIVQRITKFQEKNILHGRPK